MPALVFVSTLELSWTALVESLCNTVYNAHLGLTKERIWQVRISGRGVFEFMHA